MPVTIDLDQPATADEPEAVRRARSFLDGASESPGALDEATAEALVRSLVARGDGTRLTALASSSDKRVAKQARRGVHLLRTRGVSVEVPRSQAAPIARAEPAAEPAPPSLLSASVRDGEQMAWLVRVEPDGKLDVFQAQLREDRGLSAFEALRTTRKHWRNVTHEFFADETLPIAPVDGGYVRWLLEEAADRTASQGRVVPRTYAEARYQLGTATAPAHHPASDVIPRELVEAARSDAQRLAAVADMPELATWIPDEETARKAWLGIEEVATSRLVIDEQQRRQQAQEVVRRALADALAGPWRDRLARRLRDTALVIAGRATVGKRGRDYLADAAATLAAADQVADTSLAPDDVVVARRLFDRLLVVPTAGEPTDEAGAPPSGSSLILPGDEPRR